MARSLRRPRRAAGHGARTWARSCSEQRPTRATGPEPIVMGEGAWLNAAALAADARSTHSRFAMLCGQRRRPPWSDRGLRPLDYVS